MKSPVNIKAKFSLECQAISILLETEINLVIDLASNKTTCQGS